jgi:hypothetical protein
MIVNTPSQVQLERSLKFVKNSTKHFDKSYDWNHAVAEVPTIASPYKHPLDEPGFWTNICFAQTIDNSIS